MADPAILRLDVGRFRREFDQALRTLHDSKTELARLERQLVIFGPESEFSAQVADGEIRVQEDSQRLSDAGTRLDHVRREYEDRVADEPVVWRQGGDLPLLLLPVRLEVLRKRDGDSAQLLLRVYPDDVHVDAHEEGLTAAERDAGKRYWKAVRATGADEAARATAWTALLERLGPARATWVREAMRPGAPEPKRRRDSWTRAAHTTLLPDRFVFSAYTGVAESDFELAWRREGRDIPDTLKVAFAPPEEDGERLVGLPWDSESAWLVDFDKAVDNGMGLVVDLPTPDVVYDLLTVVGVSTGLSPKASADRWQATLLAHQHGNGLAFVPTRTPTNNTPGSRSGWMTRPEVRPPEEVDRQRGAHKPASAQAAARAARAFGIDGKPVLGAAPGALGEDEGPALTLLHKALGLLFNQSLLIRPYPPLPDEITEDTVFPPDTALPPKIPKLLDHFTEHVRSRGTLPALRIGRQPYGVLPVSSLDLWKGDEPDAMLAELLRSVSSTLETFVFFSPRVGMGGDEDSVILDLLSRVPASERMVTTQTRPVDLFETLSRKPPNAIVGSVPDGSRADFFGAPEESGRQPRGIAAPVPPQVAAVLETRPLAKLLEVADRRLANLSAAQFGNTVLDSLDEAQQAVLVPFMESGDRDFYSIALRVFADLDISTRQSQHLLSDPPDFSPGDRALIADSAKRGRALAAALVALEARAARDLPGLDRLMLEVLDTVAHRVDAWITSLSAMRLSRLRRKHPAGLCTGAYGWLLDVRDPAPLPESDGYILSPSLQHASTAAVLRSGFRAHKDKQAFAVDLQSWRVRAALEIVEGVRTGQPLGALLGYRFERGLHEEGMEVFIAGFRRAFPLPLQVGSDGAPEPAAATSIEARNVVDGQRLRRNEKEPDAPDPRDGAETIRPGATEVFARLIAELDEMVDGVADVLVAESVHHLVGGNPLRAGLSADAISRGDALPQDFEVVRTPRSATAVTHHVGLLGPPGGAPGAGGWSGARALAKLEPAVEGWCRARLGAAASWRFGLREGTAEDVGLDALGWCALDVISAGRAEAKGSPLAGALSAAGGAELDDAGEQRLRELGMLCEQLRAVLAAATPLLGVHLDPGTADAWAHADLGDLGARVRPWLKAVVEAREKLGEALGAAPPNEAALKRTLATLAARGMLAALPADGADPVAHGAHVLALLEAAGLERLPPVPADRSKAEPWARPAMMAVTAVLGDHIKVVPVLRMPLPDGTPADAGPDGVTDWLRGVAPVRPNVAALDQALVAAQVLAGGQAGELFVTQAPTVVGAPWVAAGPAPGIRSTTVLHHDGPVGGEAVAGLVVDSWAEAVPRPAGANGPEEIAGLAFHFDSPGARAPQALLLAVPPNVERGWRAEDIHGVVEEALRLARIRTLDLRDVASPPPDDPELPDLRRLLPVPGPF